MSESAGNASARKHGMRKSQSLNLQRTGAPRFSSPSKAGEAGRLLSVLLLILCLFFSGCSSSSGQTGTENSASESVTEEVSADTGSESPEASAGDVSSEEVKAGTEDSAEEDSTGSENSTVSEEASLEEDSNVADLETIPEYSGSPYVVVNDNIPSFEEEDMTTKSFETYSSLDDLDRCGEAYANIGVDLMPTEERESIGSIKPSGWHTVKYDIVDGNYLYNRCHLIGYQLTAENANEENLITGTRYLNVEGMLPFENMVADYIEETNNHVLYRVTPIFEGDNLVASGVQMEAYSVEDEGEGIEFNVYCYNVQPGIEIDYATGDSRLAEDSEETDTESESDGEETTYILNTNTMKFHLPDCSSVSSMSEQNKEEYTGSREELIAEGYDPCGRCNP